MMSPKKSPAVQAGQAVVAGNDLAGRDPAANHEKELRVDYTFNGQPGHATVRENEALTPRRMQPLASRPMGDTTAADVRRW